MTNAGFTFLELTLVLGMTVVLAAVLIFVYMTAVRTWNAQQARSGLRTELAQAIESMTRDLHQADTVVLTNANDLVFHIGTASYRFCLYSADDPGLAYTGTSYRLVKGPGTSACAQGAALASGVHPTVFSDVDGVITIDLTADREGSTVHMRTKVWPRNLP